MGRTLCLILILINSLSVQASNGLAWYTYSEQSSETYCIGKKENNKVKFPTYSTIMNDYKSEFENILYKGIRYEIPPPDYGWRPYLVDSKSFSLDEVIGHISGNEKVCVSTLVFVHLIDKLKNADHLNLNEYVSPKGLCPPPIAPPNFRVNEIQSYIPKLDLKFALASASNQDNTEELSELFLSSSHYCPALQFECNVSDEHFLAMNDETATLFKKAKYEILKIIKDKEFTTDQRLIIEGIAQEIINLIKEIPEYKDIGIALAPAAGVVYLTLQTITHASSAQVAQLGLLLSRLGVLLYSSAFKDKLKELKDKEQRKQLLLDIQDHSHYLTRQVISLRHLNDIYPGLEYIRGQFRFYDAKGDQFLLTKIESSPWEKAKSSNSQNSTVKNEDESTQESTKGEESSKSGSDSPKNVSKHEKHKKDLRRNSERPRVEDPELKRIVDQNYKPNADVGSGSTADAVRYEKLTGKPVKGRMHSKKAKEQVTRLRNWLRNNPNASRSDRSAAENILNDLLDALGDK